MKEDVLVTIGIPVYNDERFLGETIQSVIDQSYRNIVIRISDNCSTDNTENVIRKYAQLDNRIIYHRQNDPIPAMYNFKFLRDISDTKYFMWVGSHDLLMPEFVHEAVKLMELNEKGSLCYPKTKRIDM